MFGVLVIVIIILVISFLMALIISSNKDFSNKGKLTDDPKILFEDEIRLKQEKQKEIADEIEIVDDKAKVKEEDNLFDDELI
ncbi:MAG: hypothetical protein E7160_03785 [Firmicutes bacterium]|nr:hypothetical protein [Bacillota bacterium]